MKERLVGAAVLVAIAVWLIPWVLDGPEAPLEPVGGSLQLPAAEEPMPMRTQTLRLGDPEPGAEPQAAAVPAIEPAPSPVLEAPAEEDASATTDAAATAADVPAPAAARPEPEPERVQVAATAPPAATKPPPRAPAPAATGDWIVQLGSFSEEVNARRLAERSNTFGYKAEVSSYRSSGRTLYRVRVGPARSRAEADATASALKAHGIKDASVVAAR